MEKEFDSLIETFNKFEGITILGSSIDPPWIHFKSDSEKIFAIISSQVTELKDQHGCAIIVLNNPDNPEDFSYKLFFEGSDNLTAVLVLNKKLANIAEYTPRQARMKELGIPDLSLVTIRQMAVELKQRNNLTFAVVWIENSEKDNIAIEGSGSPTQLVGLLSRGTHMAIEWADKNIKFYRPGSEN